MSRLNNVPVQAKKAKQVKLKSSILRVLKVLVFIVPLIVHLMIVPVKDKLKPLVGTLDHVADFFVAYKVLILIFGTVVLLLMTFYYQIEYKALKKNNYFYYSLVAIAGVILMSTMFSKHGDVALFGYLDRYEGAFTWMAYLSLAYIAYNLVDTDEELNAIKLSFIASATIVAIIGVFQFYNMDLFKSEFGKMLILGSKYAEAGSKLVFPFPPRTVYSTLFNSNYVGSIMSVATLLTIEQVAKQRKLALKASLFIALGLILLSLIGSKSTGGLIATSLATVGLTATILIKSKLSAFKKIIIAFIVLASAIGALQLNIIQQQLDKFASSLHTESTISQQESNPFTAVDYDGRQLAITIDNSYQLFLVPYDSLLDVALSTGQVLVPTTIDGQVNYETQVSGDQIKVTLNEVSRELSIGLMREGFTVPKQVKLHFRDGRFGEGNHYLTSENVKVEVVMLFKNERMFTDRGYIWNRTIPLILDKPLLGYGADTFALHYPQLDLLGSVESGNPYDTVIDKPHSMYLGILFSFGFLGGGILLSVLICALVMQNSKWQFWTLVAFMLAGIINDSIVTLSFAIAIFMVAGLKSKAAKS